MTRIEDHPDLLGAGRPGGGPGSVVPRAEVRSYYGQPILKQPVWKPEVPWYLFTGGLAGASAVLAAGADLSGRPELARVARRVAVAGALVSPALLISDLGRPARFLNMLRVVRPTSPMNMGAWLLAAFGSAAGATALLDAGRPDGPLTRLAGLSAAVTGSALATYTGVLLADTAVPAWHDARRELPFLFAASAAASAGAAATVFTAPPETRPARRLAFAGFAAEQVAFRAIRRQLGPVVASPYADGPAARYRKAGETLGATGAVLLAAAGGRPARSWRAVGATGAALLVTSAVCTRFAVFKAGFASAADPAATVAPQRARIQTETIRRTET
ncbi:MAG TPA: NrfD/PsrC family molybdoenzyme membrane anchor subunit [Acidimicrobiia bacterium]|nr:NrfD/PsrC family molybdoenzyme membrane anchor subunit [Acidimicrobiia bacterium]